MTASVAPIRTYREFVAGRSAVAAARDVARDLALRALALGRSPKASSGWIRFPYYHHVFDDERRDFARQLDFMAELGDFIGLDQAVDMLDSGGPIDGRYFCLTFDDGFKNWITNAVPILAEKKAKATFFVVTRYIGATLDRDRELLRGFYSSGGRLMEFLDWDDCRKMVAAGFGVGSHTMNHVHLADLDDAGVESELRKSKEKIEAETGRPCHHFCCPFGRDGVDYLPARDPAIAKRVGYRSFLTGHRGAMRRGASPMLIRRDHLLAEWGNHQLRYFFSQ
jgi:peptidoglycan/xylan/chitin deacetylase (PgdA/CDA1 family)